MRIGLGTTALIKGIRNNKLDGIGTYTENLYHALIKSSKDEIIPTSFINEGNRQIISNIKKAPNFRNEVLRTLVLRGYFNETFYKNNSIDIFHSPDHYIPRLKNIPVVATIHDAIPYEHKKWFGIKRSVYHRVLRNTMAWPDHIITPSHFSKEQLVKFLNIDPINISVVHNGVGPKWSKPTSQYNLMRIRKKYKLEKDFIIFVGTIQKRKNIEGLLTAYMKLPKNLHTSFNLVIIGRSSENCETRKALTELTNKQNNIIWLKDVDNASLVPLMQAATVMVFPSFAEGFGLPILEAFASGTPVIASNTTSIPEIAGDAAMLVNPNDSDDISKQLAKLLEAPEKRSFLSNKGKLRVEDFSWKATADRTIEIYQRAMENWIKKTENVS
jgi:glycosyltransferase involved in cell wall biosynthesis